MNILTLYQDLTHRQPVRAAATNGGEYHGPCPGCGGDDRFHLWPEQRDGGTYWCRGCGKAGDLIQFRMDFLGEDFKTAAAACGKELDGRRQKPPVRPWTPPAARATATPWSPERHRAPDETWMAHAAKLVDWAHEQLLSDAGAPRRRWLAARGITMDGIERFRLGWNPGRGGKDLYRERKGWGLPEERKPDGRAKKLWIPRGLVIPLVVDGDVWRVRIRRDEDRGPRYYVLPGSGMRQMVIPGDRRAAVVVESELDAVMIACQAGDLVTAVGLGSANIKPDAAAHEALADAARILVAMDRDKAGRDAVRWWRAHYPAARRWPTTAGKDPGEAYQAGVDIRAWVLGGLPEAWTVGPAVSDWSVERSGATPTESGKGVENDDGDTRDGRAAVAAAGQPAGCDGAGMDEAVPVGAAAGLGAGVEEASVAALGGCGAAPEPAPERRDGVAELIDILRRYPVRIINTDRRVAVEPLRDGWHNPAVMGRLSRLVFFDDDVAAWLDGMAAEEITGGNVACKQR